MQVAASVELNDREAHFVGALANGLRPTRAAREAGFSIGHARALLAKPRVRAALRALSSNAEAVLRELEGQP